MDDGGNIRRIAEARARSDGGKDFKLLQLEQLQPTRQNRFHMRNDLCT